MFRKNVITAFLLLGQVALVSLLFIQEAEGKIFSKSFGFYGELADNYEEIFSDTWEPDLSDYYNSSAFFKHKDSQDNYLFFSPLTNRHQERAPINRPLYLMHHQFLFYDC